MASSIESKAVFEKRATQLGLTAPEILQLEAVSLNTFGNLAFGCNWQPGMIDDTPLKDLAATVFNGVPTVRLMTIFRRLFSESTVLATAELRSRVEDDDDKVRKVAGPERQARREAQILALPGLRPIGEMEPSNLLVDKTISQYDGNELKYIPIEKCTSRQQEMMGDKEDVELVRVEKRTKALSLGTAPVETNADVSTDLKVKNALLRRALAYDQATLITFSVQVPFVNLLYFKDPVFR